MLEKGVSWRCDDSIVTKTAKLSAKSPCSFPINYTLIQAPELGSIQRRWRIERVAVGCPSRRRTLKLTRLNFPQDDATKYCALIQAPQLGSIQRRGRIETVGTGSNRRMTLKLRRLNFPKVKRPSIARAAMSIEARVRARSTELYLGF
jgi:hypothetical protein